MPGAKKKSKKSKESKRRRRSRSRERAREAAYPSAAPPAQPPPPPQPSAAHHVATGLRDLPWGGPTSPPLAAARPIHGPAPAPPAAVPRPAGVTLPTGYSPVSPAIPARPKKRPRPDDGPPAPGKRPRPTAAADAARMPPPADRWRPVFMRSKAAKMALAKSPHATISLTAKRWGITIPGSNRMNQSSRAAALIRGLKEKGYAYIEQRRGVATAHERVGNPNATGQERNQHGVPPATSSSGILPETHRAQPIDQTETSINTPAVTQIVPPTVAASTDVHGRDVPLPPSSAPLTHGGRETGEARRRRAMAAAEPARIAREGRDYGTATREMASLEPGGETPDSHYGGVSPSPWGDVSPFGGISPPYSTDTSGDTSVSRGRSVTEIHDIRSHSRAYDPQEAVHDLRSRTRSPEEADNPVPEAAEEAPPPPAAAPEEAAPPPAAPPAPPPAVAAQHPLPASPRDEASRQRAAEALITRDPNAPAGTRRSTRPTRRPPQFRTQVPHTPDLHRPPRYRDHSEPRGDITTGSETETEEAEPSEDVSDIEVLAGPAAIQRPDIRIHRNTRLFRYRERTHQGKKIHHWANQDGIWEQIHGDKVVRHTPAADLYSRGLQWYGEHWLRPIPTTGPVPALAAPAPAGAQSAPPSPVRLAQYRREHPKPGQAAVTPLIVGGRDPDSMEAQILRESHRVVVGGRLRPGTRERSFDDRGLFADPGTAPISIEVRPYRGTASEPRRRSGSEPYTADERRRMTEALRGMRSESPMRYAQPFTRSLTRDDSEDRPLVPFAPDPRRGRSLTRSRSPSRRARSQTPFAHIPTQREEEALEQSRRYELQQARIRQREWQRRHTPRRGTRDPPHDEKEQKAQDDDPAPDPDFAFGGLDIEDDLSDFGDPDELNRQPHETHQQYLDRLRQLNLLGLVRQPAAPKPYNASFIRVRREPPRVRREPPVRPRAPIRRYPRRRPPPRTSVGTAVNRVHGPFRGALSTMPKLSWQHKGPGHYVAKARQGMTPGIRQHVLKLLSRAKGHLWVNGKRMTVKKARGVILKLLGERQSVEIKLSNQFPFP